MGSKKQRILLVDDDIFISKMVQIHLESDGYLVTTAVNGKDALEKYFRDPSISLIVSDMKMPEMNAMEFIKELRKKDGDVPIIILTVVNDVSIALEAIRFGANDYLFKDENIKDALLLSVKKVYESHKMERENALLPNTDMKGASVVAEAMRASVAALNIPHDWSEAAGHVTVSLGVASVIPDKGSKPTDLISLADKALYAAKQEGRNRVKLMETLGNIDPETSSG